MPSLEGRALPYPTHRCDALRQQLYAEPPGQYLARGCLCLGIVFVMRRWCYLKIASDCIDIADLMDGLDQTDDIMCVCCESLCNVQWCLIVFLLQGSLWSIVIPKKTG